MTWTGEAACRDIVQENPEFKTAWDNIDHGNEYLPDPLADAAKKVCYGCPVRRQCIEAAVADPEAEGIRGGYRFHMGLMSRSEANKLQREFGIKGKVKRGGKSNDVPDFNLSEVRTND